MEFVDLCSSEDEGVSSPGGGDASLEEGGGCQPLIFVRDLAEITEVSSDDDEYLQNQRPKSQRLKLEDVATFNDCLANLELVAEVGAERPQFIEPKLARAQGKLAAFLHRLTARARLIPSGSAATKRSSEAPGVGVAPAPLPQFSTPSALHAHHQRARAPPAPPRPQLPVGQQRFLYNATAGQIRPLMQQQRQVGPGTPPPARPPQLPRKTYAPQRYPLLLPRPEIAPPVQNVSPAPPTQAPPSIVVPVKPQLQRPPAKNALNPARPQLDKKVTTILALTFAQFVNWLLNQGLLKSNLSCALHPNRIYTLEWPSSRPEDVFTGGVRWIAPCCSREPLPLFTGSIFEGTPFPPKTCLKLMYHWICQTPLERVLLWCDLRDQVDAVQNFYSVLRTVCLMYVHDYAPRIGGPGKKVEVGVVILSCGKSETVEILGILDVDTKVVRMRVLLPEGVRHSQVMGALAMWVDKRSLVHVHETGIAAYWLKQAGYSQVTIFAAADTVMKYLRQVLPQVILKTQNSMSKARLQQFLEELSWREQYGSASLAAFDSLLQQVMQVTQWNSGNLVERAERLCQNPWLDWSIDKQTPKPTAAPKLKSVPLPAQKTPENPPPPPKKQKMEAAKKLVSVPFTTRPYPIRIPEHAHKNSCIECGHEIGTANHFVGRLECTQCRFLTSCARSMSLHQERVHSLEKARPPAVKTRQQAMECPCGYRSQDPGALADHLVACRKYTAHPRRLT